MRPDAPTPAPEPAPRAAPREPPLPELSARAELARAELARDLLQHGGPVPGEGTRRWVARGETLRRQLLAEAAREPKPLRRGVHVHRGSADGLSIDELDREVDRVVGRTLRRLVWIVCVVTIGAAAWLGFQVVIGGH